MAARTLTRSVPSLDLVIRRRRYVLFILLCLFITYLRQCNTSPRLGLEQLQDTLHRSTLDVPDNSASTQQSIVAPLDSFSCPSVASDLTVNLVIASVEADDASWTTQLRDCLPNLHIIRYVSDSATAPHRPRVPQKGREAAIYHTYFHDYYHNLPDVSIMIHADEDPWHADGVLQQSMLFALSRLDLEHVQRRQYANLRVSWVGACPDWINTTSDQLDPYKQEEPFMRSAWKANFDLLEDPIPEILGGPCCSQFAVTGDAVRRRPRAQYARSLDWLLTTDWPDAISGRVWEHMFQWLFLRRASDCSVEWKVYCAMYHICFDASFKPDRYNSVWGLSNLSWQAWRAA